MSINITIIHSPPCSSGSPAFLGLASLLIFNPSGSPTHSTLSWKILQFPLEIAGFRSPDTQTYTDKHTALNRPSVYDVIVLCMCVCWSEVAQWCPTLCDPTDCSPPGPSVQGLLQARILEWVAISFPRGSTRPRDRTCISSTSGRLLTIWATREASCVY